MGGSFPQVSLHPPLRALEHVINPADGGVVALPTGPTRGADLIFAVARFSVARFGGARSPQTRFEQERFAVERKLEQALLVRQPLLVRCRFDGELLLLDGDLRRYRHGPNLPQAPQRQIARGADRVFLPGGGSRSRSADCVIRSAWLDRPMGLSRR